MSKLSFAAASGHEAAAPTAPALSATVSDTEKRGRKDAADADETAASSREQESATADETLSLGQRRRRRRLWEEEVEEVGSKSAERAATREAAKASGEVDCDDAISERD